jgi:hypothetical protein
VVVVVVIVFTSYACVYLHPHTCTL